LNASGSNVDAFFEITTCDFFEWQEAVAIFSVVDETGF